MRSEDDRRVSQLIALYGQKTDRLYVTRNGQRRRVFWQSRCYDHPPQAGRTPEKTREKINYCHNNPVTRGLVKSPGTGRGPVTAGMKTWMVWNWRPMGLVYDVLSPRQSAPTASGWGTRLTKAPVVVPI